MYVPILGLGIQAYMEGTICLLPLDLDRIQVSNKI